MKFAAIDIGSNAVRLLLANVYEHKGKPDFKKGSLIRVPIRLGDDVFLTQRISKEKTQNLVKTMMAFKYLAEVYEPLDIMACATASMREAVNNQEVIDLIKKETGISIEIIDGKREAEIIYSNHVAEDIDSSKSYLYIDVGGGSTELTLFSKGKRIGSNSFNIGTIRILDHADNESEWKRLQNWVENETQRHQPITGIGTGGNINKIFKISEKKEGKPLSYKNLKEIYENLNSYSLEARIEVLGLKPDRADVIIPAAEIFLKIMKWSKISEIYVPQIGLSDGIIHVLYERFKLKTGNGRL